MKIHKPIRPMRAENERAGIIRSMALNFRKRTLTPADHLLISAWLDESETNQQLFEKWILQPGAIQTTESGPAMMHASVPRAPLRKVSAGIIGIILFLTMILLLFLLLR